MLGKLSGREDLNLRPLGTHITSRNPASFGLGKGRGETGGSVAAEVLHSFVGGAHVAKCPLELGGAGRFAGVVGRRLVELFLEEGAVGEGEDVLVDFQPAAVFGEVFFGGFVGLGRLGRLGRGKRR